MSIQKILFIIFVIFLAFWLNLCTLVWVVKRTNQPAVNTHPPKQLFMQHCKNLEEEEKLYTYDCWVLRRFAKK